MGIDNQPILGDGHQLFHCDSNRGMDDRTTMARIMVIHKV